MTNAARRTVLLGVLLCTIGVSVLAQRSSRSRRYADINDPRASQNSVPTPEWKYESGFENDVFTFVRIIYSTGGRSRRGWGGGRWMTDWPDADLNFAWRLQQMTSLRVDPKGR